jgi:sugar phosphate isomerase/epimerase
MKLGVFTPVFGKLTLDDVLVKVRALHHITALELGTGGWPGSDHLDIDALLDKPCAAEYRKKIEDAGLTISALSCHNNPLHPDAATAKVADDVLRKTIRLAEQLEVPVVVTFSGCPGDCDDAKHPNWVTAPWPPEFLDILEWQWEKKAIPYWSGMAQFAGDHGVKVALEAHPGFVVYNVESALRLRKATSPNIGVNFDPSHFFWQGVDVPPRSVRSATRFFTSTPRTSRSIRTTSRSTVSSTRSSLSPGWLRAIVAVPQRRLGHDVARMEAHRSALRLSRLRSRDEHRARGSAGVGRRRSARDVDLLSR